MEFKNIWIWDQDKKICISTRAVRYFDIEEGAGEIKYSVYANLDNDRTVTISEHKTLLGAQNKIENLLAYARY